MPVPDRPAEQARSGPDRGPAAWPRSRPPARARRWRRSCDRQRTPRRRTRRHSPWWRCESNRECSAMADHEATRNPFTMLSARQVYDNPWITVVEHQVLSPRGRPGIYGVVKFKNQAVGVIPYEGGKLWLVGQYRVPLGAYSWEIPEGGSPHGEDPVEGARRELREETGLEAQTLEPIVEMHLSNSVSDEWGVVYLARGITAGAAEPEHTE